MNTSDSMFGQTLATWLQEDAEHRIPEHLGEVLIRSVATRQRAWWSSPGRWIPMDTVVAPRGMNPRSLAWLAALAALLLAAAGLALWAGSRHPAPVLGLATNGRILVAVDGAIESYAADGTSTGKLPAIVQRGSAADLAISPDGTRLAYQPASAPGRIDILSLSDGSAHSVALPAGVVAQEPFAWSADGRQLVFTGYAIGPRRIYIAAADGSSVAAVGEKTIPSTITVGRPILSPDGRWIAFEGMMVGPEVPALYLIRPDGSGLRQVAEFAGDSSSGAASWAPDASAERLLYVDGYGAIRIHDAATTTETYVADGSWPTWSPDGSRVAFWNRGTTVVSSADMAAGASDATRPFRGLTGTCRGQTDVDGSPVCGPVAWSPDGTLVIGYDADGASLMIAAADGSGTQRQIALATPTEVRIGWQPVRP